MQESAKGWDKAAQVMQVAAASSVEAPEMNKN